MTDVQTVIKNNNLRNYIAKLDVKQKAFDNRVTIDLGMFGALQKNDLIPSRQKLLYSAATFNPTFPDGKNASGGYDQVPEAYWINNPNSLLEMQEEEKNVHMNVHLKAEVYLGYGLRFGAFGSYSYNDIGNAHFYPTYVWGNGEAYRGDTKREELLGNLVLFWHRSLATDRKLDLMAMVEAQRETTTGFYTTVSSFSTNAYGFDNLSAGATRPWEGTNSFYSNSTMMSYLFKAQYNFADRFTLNFSARADGSSKVGENHRWGGILPFSKRFMGCCKRVMDEKPDMDFEAESANGLRKERKSGRYRLLPVAAAYQTQWSGKCKRRTGNHSGYHSQCQS